MCPTPHPPQSGSAGLGVGQECKIPSPYTGYAFIRGYENIMPSAYNTTKLKLAGEGNRFNTNVNGILNWYSSGNYPSISYPEGITITLSPHKGSRRRSRYEGFKYVHCNPHFVFIKGNRDFMSLAYNQSNPFLPVEDIFSLALFYVILEYHHYYLTIRE